MIEKIKGLHRNSLFANSMYLILASGVVAAFGFIFWAVVARNFSDSQVGIATTLLSLSSLIALLSLAGFDTTFVRFLPKSERKEDYINSGLIIVSVLSAVIAILFVIGFPLFAPDLAFVTHSLIYSLAFVIFTIFTSLNTLTNAIFLAYRKTIYTFFVNLIFSALKVILPLLIVHGGAMTIFNISGIAQVIGVVLSFVVMSNKFGHVFLPKVHFDILRLSRKYSFAVYGSSLLNLLPPTLLPLIITHRLDPKYSAYYYMAFTIATLLYTVAYSSMQSVFAESSHVEEHLKQHLFKAGKVLGGIMVPSIIVLIAVAPYILLTFGDSYRDNGTALLRLFSLSALFVAVYSALGTVFKVMHATLSLLLMNIAYTATILFISYSLIVRNGLVVVGWAWLLGNFVAIVVGLTSFVVLKRR